MGKYKVLIKPSAAKQIETIPKRDRVRVARRVQALGDDPRPMGCEKLSGLEQYRVRQGRYRIVYEVADRDLTVLVVKVAHRREVYR